MPMTTKRPLQAIKTVACWHVQVDTVALTHVDEEILHIYIIVEDFHFIAFEPAEIFSRISSTEDHRAGKPRISDLDTQRRGPESNYTEQYTIC